MAETRIIEVKARDGAYRVIIGSGVREQLADFADIGTALLITDENVAREWPQLVPHHAKFVLPPGEATKSLEWANKLWRWLAQNGANRDAIVIALGGGVIGDLAGFVAATFHRGIPLVHVPTTLLAQVDSSIGGKTAIDLPEGKNLVGAFHRPFRVLSDTDFLRTLPERQVWNGLAELVKTALIGDAELFAELERTPHATPEAIARAASIKAAIVSRDERDQGERMKLNFGHTIGHAIEAATNYELLHGEAVVIGMRAELELGEVAESKRIRNLLARFPIPRIAPPRREELVAALRRDKKGARVPVLEGIGRARVREVHDLDRAIDAALEQLS